MIQSILANLQDPLYEGIALAFVAVIATAVYLRSQRKLSFASLALAWRVRVGTVELENQSWSGTITVLLLAVGGVFGYMVYQGVLTGTCSATLGKIATANDLRMQYGQGYETNGNVTAANIKDANGNTYGITSDPRDWAAAAASKYTWTATQTNGDWSYTAKCPGTHAGWTTVLLSGGGVTHTQLQWVGPNGSVSAV